MHAGSEHQPLQLLKLQEQNKQSPHLVKVPIALQQFPTEKALLQLPGKEALSQRDRFALIDLRNVQPTKRDMQTHFPKFYFSHLPKNDSRGKVFSGITQKSPETFRKPFLRRPNAPVAKGVLLSEPAMMINPHIQKALQDEPDLPALPMLVYPKQWQTKEVSDQELSDPKAGPPGSIPQISTAKKKQNPSRSRARRNRHSQAALGPSAPRLNLKSGKDQSIQTDTKLLGDGPDSSNLFDILLQAALYDNSPFIKNMPVAFPQEAWSAGNQMAGQSHVQPSSRHEDVLHTTKPTVNVDPKQVNQSNLTLKETGTVIAETSSVTKQDLDTKPLKENHRKEEPPTSDIVTKQLRKVTLKDLRDDIDYSWSNLYKLRDKTLSNEEPPLNSGSTVLVLNKGIQTDISPDNRSVFSKGVGFPLITEESHKSKGIQHNANNELFDFIKPALNIMQSNNFGQDLLKKQMVGKERSPNCVESHQDSSRKESQSTQQLTQAIDVLEEQSIEEEKKLLAKDAKLPEVNQAPTFVPELLSNLKLVNEKIEVQFQEPAKEFISLTDIDTAPVLSQNGIEGVGSIADKKRAITDASEKTSDNIYAYKTDMELPSKNFEIKDFTEPFACIDESEMHKKEGKSMAKPVAGRDRISQDLKTMSLQLEALENLQRYLEADLKKSKLLLGTVESIQDVYDPPQPATITEGFSSTVRFGPSPPITDTLDLSDQGKLSRGNTPTNPLERVSTSHENLNQSLAGSFEEADVKEQVIRSPGDNNRGFTRSQGALFKEERSISNPTENITDEKQTLTLATTITKKEKEPDVKTQLEKKRQNLLKWMKKRRRQAMESYVNEVDSKRQAEARPFRSTPVSQSVRKTPLHEKQTRVNANEVFSERVTSAKLLLDDIKSTSKVTQKLMTSTIHTPKHGSSKVYRKTSVSGRKAEHAPNRRSTQLNTKKRTVKENDLHSEKTEDVYLPLSARTDVSAETLALIEQFIPLDKSPVDPALSGELQQLITYAAPLNSSRLSYQAVRASNDFVMLSPEDIDDHLNASYNSGKDFITAASYEHYQKKRSKLVRQTLREFSNENPSTENSLEKETFLQKNFKDSNRSRDESILNRTRRVNKVIPNSGYSVQHTFKPVEDRRNGDSKYVPYAHVGDSRTSYPEISSLKNRRSSDIERPGGDNDPLFDAAVAIGDDSVTADLLAQADAVLAARDDESEEGYVGGITPVAGSIDWNEIDHILGED